MESRVTGSFKCTDDDGKIYTVIEHTKIVTFKPNSGVAEKTKGTKSLYLSNGHSVNYIDGEKFQVVETDAIIRKI